MEKCHFRAGRCRECGNKYVSAQRDVTVKEHHLVSPWRNVTIGISVYRDVPRNGIITELQL